MAACFSITTSTISLILQYLNSSLCCFHSFDNNITKNDVCQNSIFSHFLRINNNDVMLLISWMHSVELTVRVKIIAPKVL